jgi:hypothetical protein
MAVIVCEKHGPIPNLEGSANQSVCRAGCRSSPEDEGREGSPRQIHLQNIPKYQFLMCEMQMAPKKVVIEWNKHTLGRYNNGAVRTGLHPTNLRLPWIIPKFNLTT